MKHNKDVTLACMRSFLADKHTADVTDVCTTYSLVRDVLCLVSVLLGITVVWKSVKPRNVSSNMGSWYILFGVCNTVLAVAGLMEGIQPYRVDLERAYGLNTAQRLCYAYETEATTVENDSILGVRLLATTEVSDPWFHNAGMTLYAMVCFYGIGVSCVLAVIQWFLAQQKPGPYVAQQHRQQSTNKVVSLLRRASMPFSLPNKLPVDVPVAQRKFTIDYNAPNAVEERLASLLTAWLLTLALVAYFFAPLPICRFITTLGLVHNIIEMMIIRELGLASPHMRKWRWTVWVWGGGEILGGVLLGTVESQFMTFGLMGAMCDLGIFVVSTLVIYDSKLPARWFAAIAFYAHCTYVMLYFANCLVYPPLGKILGVYFNMLASMLGSYSVYHLTTSNESVKRLL